MAENKATKISPRFGGEMARFGKWIVTTKGILFERIQFGEADYFLDNNTTGNLYQMRILIEQLLNESWLDEIDYHQFITAWFYKLSLLKINANPDEPTLSDTLMEMQGELEKKFARNLIN